MGYSGLCQPCRATSSLAQAAKRRAVDDARADEGAKRHKAVEDVRADEGAKRSEAVAAARDAATAVQLLERLAELRGENARIWGVLDAERAERAELTTALTTAFAAVAGRAPQITNISLDFSGIARAMREEPPLMWIRDLGAAQQSEPYRSGVRLSLADLAQGVADFLGAAQKENFDHGKVSPAAREAFRLLRDGLSPEELQDGGQSSDSVGCGPTDAGAAITAIAEVADQQMRAAARAVLTTDAQRELDALPCTMPLIQALATLAAGGP